MPEINVISKLKELLIVDHDPNFHKSKAAGNILDSYSQNQGILINNFYICLTFQHSFESGDSGIEKLQFNSLEDEKIFQTKFYKYVETHLQSILKWVLADLIKDKKQDIDGEISSLTLKLDNLKKLREFNENINIEDLESLKKEDLLRLFYDFNKIENNE